VTGLEEGTVGDLLIVSQVPCPRFREFLIGNPLVVQQRWSSRNLRIGFGKSSSLGPCSSSRRVCSGQQARSIRVSSIDMPMFLDHSGQRYRDSGLLFRYYVGTSTRRKENCMQNMVSSLRLRFSLLILILCRPSCANCTQ
jgi:hypothetical protein